ncbi:hypothetical protein FB548_2260 [Pseudoxanthomonas sp. 3HH-4]|nr:hypothetical protein FB548_2260 [Pseudoxanthomonas sp. 3HH-4]
MLEPRSLRSTCAHIQTRKVPREQQPLIRPPGTFSPQAGRRDVRHLLRAGEGIQRQAMRSTLPMYGRSTSGTVIEPSAFW